MRFAPQHVDLHLALRDLLCNERWSEGWGDYIITFQLQQQRQKRCLRAHGKQPPPPTHITFSALQAADLLPTADTLQELSPSQVKPKRDPKDHPWRRNLWPTKESWRWTKYRQQNRRTPGLLYPPSFQGTLKI